MSESYLKIGTDAEPSIKSAIDRLGKFTGIMADISPAVGMQYSLAFDDLRAAIKRAESDGKLPDVKP